MLGREDEVLILPADGNADISGWLETILVREGYSVTIARKLDSWPTRDERAISAIILDYSWNGQDGLQTLEEVRISYPGSPIIVISNSFSPQQVVSAVRNGAADFLPKPVNRDDLSKALRIAIEARSSPPPEAPAKPSAAWGKNIFYGTNPYMRELESMIAQISWSQAPLLIEGETGAGKEVVARELHSLSTRAQKRFLKLNCAALPSELVESELFGYERGAFTGAFQRKLGMFELADGGTIFLDEIGDMDIKLQAKLLQVLQDHEFQRLGGKETVRVDVRIIAATHRDLEKAILRHEFREDLYYRLNVISLRVPPLRERKEDLFEIAGFLLHKHHAQGMPLPVVTADLKEAMLNYDWPGNIRELENVIRKFLILKDADFVARDLRRKMDNARLLSRETKETKESTVLQAETTILGQVSRAKEHAERTAILSALNSTNWNRKKAAFLLKIEYKALLYKMRKLSIDDKMAALPFGTPAAASKAANAL